MFFSLDYSVQILAALAVTFCFAVLFNCKGKSILYSSLAGALSWLVYLLGIYLDWSLGLSYFAACFAISLFAELAGRIQKIPVTSIIIPAMIPLAPGGGVYYTMFFILDKSYDLALAKGIDTALIAAAMALGIFAASVFFRVLQEIRKTFF